MDKLWNLNRTIDLKSWDIKNRTIHLKWYIRAHSLYKYEHNLKFDEEMKSDTRFVGEGECRVDNDRRNNDSTFWTQMPELNEI